MSESKNDVRNSDYVGDAAKQEKVQQGPYRTEKVWEWECAKPDCGRNTRSDPDKRKVRTPAGTPPYNCRQCGGDAWNKTGEKVRPAKMKPTPQGDGI